MKCLSYQISRQTKLLSYEQRDEVLYSPTQCGVICQKEETVFQSIGGVVYLD